MQHPGRRKKSATEKWLSLCCASARTPARSSHPVSISTFHPRYPSPHWPHCPPPLRDVCLCVRREGTSSHLCVSVCAEILLQCHGGRAAGFPQVPAPAQTQASAARHGQNWWSHQHAHLQWPETARQRDHGLKRTPARSFLSLETGRNLGRGGSRFSIRGRDLKCHFKQLVIENNSRNWNIFPVEITWIWAKFEFPHGSRSPPEQRLSGNF